MNNVCVLSDRNTTIITMLSYIAKNNESLKFNTFELDINDNKIIEKFSDLKPDVLVIASIGLSDKNKKLIHKLLVADQSLEKIIINKDINRAEYLMLLAVEASFTEIICYGSMLEPDVKLISSTRVDDIVNVKVKVFDKDFSFSLLSKELIVDSLAVIAIMETCHYAWKELSKGLISYNHKNSQPFIKIPYLNQSSKHRLYTSENKNEFEILFVGDTSFGENYQNKTKDNGGHSILELNGYDYPLKKMKRIMTESDCVISNLETPITNIKESPYKGDKAYIHWTSIDKSPQTLLEHNVSAVGLANNHTLDFGGGGFEQTIDILEQNDLPFMGAGKNIIEAAQPFIGEIKFKNNTFRFAVISAFEELKNYREKYNVYATADDFGLMPLNVDIIETLILDLKHKHPGIFIILFPHWGNNYKWRDKYQVTMGNKLLSAGADIIIGHGAHMIQEFERYNDRWVLYSLGNFMFNSRGRHKKLNAPPYSYIAKLNIQSREDVFDLSLNLYPIISNNTKTNYQPRFLSQREFNDLCNIVINKRVNKATQLASLFRNKDDYGYHFTLPLLPQQLTGPVPESRTVGLMCRIVNVKPLEEYMFIWMYHAIPISKELTKLGYQLFSYTAADVNPNTMTAKGYIFKGGQFESVELTIPKVNYDWHIGRVKLDGKPGFKLREYEKWLSQFDHKIFPPKKFRLLMNNKYECYQMIAAIDPKIVPYTENFSKDKAQILKFLQSQDAVFIKPRSGSMGDEIIVLRVTSTGYTIDFYRNKIKTRETHSDIDSVMQSLLEKTSLRTFIIQDAIKTKRYNDSAYDIRVSMANDGKDFHFLWEARVGAAHSDLSNISQGGDSYQAEEILKDSMSDQEIESFYLKIEAISKKIANSFNKEYKDSIIEFAIDYMIDENNQPFIAELNSKPGMPGMPDMFNDFLHMNSTEKEIYENKTLVHARHLSKFLVKKSREYYSK